MSKKNIREASHETLAPRVMSRVQATSAVGRAGHTSAVMEHSVSSRGPRGFTVEDVLRSEEAAALSSLVHELTRKTVVRGAEGIDDVNATALEGERELVQRCHNGAVEALQFVLGKRLNALRRSKLQKPRDTSRDTGKHLQLLKLSTLHAAHALHRGILGPATEDNSANALSLHEFREDSAGRRAEAICDLEKVSTAAR